MSLKCGANAYTTLRHITPSHQLALLADCWCSTSFQHYPSILYPLQSARVVLLHLLPILHLTCWLLANHWFINACLPNGLLILKSSQMPLAAPMLLMDPLQTFLHINEMSLPSNNNYMITERMIPFVFLCLLDPLPMAANLLSHTAISTNLFHTQHILHAI